MSDISSRILHAIAEKGVSYGELARLTGIPKSALQRYATGETEKIPVPRLKKIADALSVSAAYLMGWGGADLPEAETVAVQQPEMDPAEEYLLETYRQLNPQGQEYILQTVHMAAQIYKNTDSSSGMEEQDA